jgi:hypothetical protein
MRKCADIVIAAQVANRVAQGGHADEPARRFGVNL